MLSEVREKVYRVEWERWVSVATYAVLTLALLFMADDGSSGPGSASTLARVIGYVMVAGAVVLVVRSIRIGIVMSSDRVVVRGILCTRHFATRDVDRFLMLNGHGGLYLRSGKRVHLWHIQLPNQTIFPGSRTAELIVDNLNNDLREQRLTTHG